MEVKTLFYYCLRFCFRSNILTPPPHQLQTWPPNSFAPPPRATNLFSASNQRFQPPQRYQTPERTTTTQPSPSPNASQQLQHITNLVKTSFDRKFPRMPRSLVDPTPPESRQRLSHAPPPLSSSRPLTRSPPLRIDPTGTERFRKQRKSSATPLRFSGRVFQLIRGRSYFFLGGHNMHHLGITHNLNKSIRHYSVSLREEQIPISQTSKFFSSRLFSYDKDYGIR